MSNKLIKNYKLINEGSIEPKQVNRIVKSGDFKMVQSSARRPDKSATQKKKHDKSSRKSSRAGKIKPELSLEMPQSALSSDPKLPDKNSTNPTSSENEIDSPESIEEKLKAEYEIRIQEESSQAYNRGLNEGRTNAVAVNDARIAEARKIFDLIKTELNKSAGLFFEEIEKLAMDMSMHLASKIIGDAVHAVPDIVKSNVDKCLALVAGAGEVQIKINPSDYDTIKGYLPSLEQQVESRFSFILDPDRNIDKGGCLIEFEGSVIDGRIETQFQKIREQMEILT